MPRPRHFHRALVVLSLLFGASSCEDAPTDARQAQIVSSLASADEPVIRARPMLSAGKYVRMASGAFPFYRGSVPVFRSDMRSGTTSLATSRFALDVPLVASLGDPHPENFGALRASDGTLALEPNDFDSADRAPYLWDVRRMAAGVALAAALSNPEDESARMKAAEAREEIVRQTITGYRDAIMRAAAGSPPGRITTSASPIVADLFKRSTRDSDARKELDELTTVTEGQRRLKRGAVDPEDPQAVFAELPRPALDALGSVIEHWRRSLISPPPAEDFALLDAVREFGSGVASWPRVRALLLVRGPSDDPSDDLLLELKEIADAGTGNTYAAAVHFDSVGQRIVWSARAAWGRPDAEPLWGYAQWLGLPCQMRVETEGQKGVKVERMAEDEGTPEAIASLGVDIGTIVARVHASGDKGIENARAIWKRIADDPSGFVEEQVEAGLAYADLVLEDHARFVRFLHRADGLRLGVPFDPLDAPSPDLAALYGLPPPPPPLPSNP